MSSLWDAQRHFVNRVVNPYAVAMIGHGLAPSTYALVETTGRRTGRDTDSFREVGLCIGSTGSFSGGLRTARHR